MGLNILDVVSKLSHDILVYFMNVYYSFCSGLMLVHSWFLNVHLSHSTHKVHWVTFLACIQSKEAILQVTFMKEKCDLYGNDISLYTYIPTYIHINTFHLCNHVFSTGFIQNFGIILSIIFVHPFLFHPGIYPIYNFSFQLWLLCICEKLHGHE